MVYFSSRWPIGPDSQNEGCGRTGVELKRFLGGVVKDRSLVLLQTTISPTHSETPFENPLVSTVRKYQALTKG